MKGWETAPRKTGVKTWDRLQSLWLVLKVATESLNRLPSERIVTRAASHECRRRGGSKPTGFGLRDVYYGVLDKHNQIERKFAKKRKEKKESLR